MSPSSLRTSASKRVHQPGMRLAAASAVLGLTSACVPAGQPPAFYRDVPASTDTAPGTLIKYEPLPQAPPGSHAYRIVYWSTADDGRPTPVSGMVIIPDKPAEAAGRPVAAWAHPTTGVQPRCAPSLSPLRFVMTSGLRALLDRGFIVTASDYPGLGTGLTHPFLDGPSEGRAVLDSVRAARGLPGASPSARYTLWGHSQGGQAVLFAASIAARYAPELQLAGVAAAAPATDLGALFRDDLGTSGGNNLAALTLWSWHRVYGLNYSTIVAPQAEPAIAEIADKCIDTLIESRAKRRAGKVLAAEFFTVPDVTKVEPWQTYITRNSAPIVPPGIPVFLAQGTADAIVNPKVTYGYAARLCRTRLPVTLVQKDKVGHGWIAAKSATQAADWMRDRIDAKPAPSDCETIAKIG